MSLSTRPTLAAARAAGTPWFLHRLHPLAKLAGPAPMIVVLFFSQGPELPLASIGVSLALLLLGCELRLLTRLALLVGVPAMLGLLTVTLALWVDAERAGASPPWLTLGPWPITEAAARSALASAARLLGIVMLALVAGLTTSGVDFVHALVQQLRVPYRFAYAGLAAFRFVPRFRSELAIIRQAHRMRGLGGAGPAAWLRGQQAAVVPLLAAALRHAERVAMAMDARAFGFAATRTERHPVPVRAGDAVFVALCWFAAAAALLLPPLLAR